MIGSLWLPAANGETAPTTHQTASRPSTRPDFHAAEDFLVFPGFITQGTPQANWRTSTSEELLSLTTKDGTKIAAVFGKGVNRNYATTNRASIAQTHRPTLLYFYGNGTCMAASRQIFNEFRWLGYDVIMPDYPGYGLSAGKPTEAGCYAAADAAYDYLLTRHDIDSKRIVAAGWSLGAAIAIDLASRRPVAGLITFSAFTNINAIGNKMAPGIPAQLIPLVLNSRFENLEKIPLVRCPILLFHGNVDTLVPPQMEDSLAAAAITKTTKLRIPRAGHNDVFSTGGATLFQQVGKFVDELN
jgi:hypothetical protein